MRVPASQSLMSPSLGVQLLVTHPLKKKLLVCVCVCASLCTYTHKYIVAVDFLLVLAGTKTISYWHSQKKIQKKINVCLSTTLLTFLGIFTQQQLICMLHELQLSIIRDLNFLYQYPIRNQISLTPPAPLSYLESLHSHALSLFPWAMNS